jgi:hypothetical protein
MFKIATILRKKQAPNIYRSTLLGAFSTGVGDDFLLCSGFFQEKKYKVTSYYASQSFIHNAPALPCAVNLTTVGVYDKKVWGAQYDDFAKALATIKCHCGKPLSVTKRKPKTANKWHAKIFIARKNGVPQLAIIGSSNITKNAFDEKKGWNRECDTVIWRVDNPAADAVVRSSVSSPDTGEAIRNDEMRHEVIVSIYDGEDPMNSGHGPMDNRLNQLWDDVIGETDGV